MALKQSSNLAILAFGQFQFDHALAVGGGDDAGLLGTKRFAAFGDAFTKTIEHLLFNLAFHQGDIGFRHRVSGMGQLQRELAVVGQEEQTFGLQIETPHRKQIVPFHRQQIENGVAAGLVLAAADVAGGFVQGYVEFSPGLDRASIDRDDMLRRVHLGAEFLNDASIYADASGNDDFLTRAPGRDTRLGEISLQANRRHKRKQERLWESAPEKATD